MAIKIDPEFQSLIPPLTEAEAAGLEASIKAEGCRDPLVLWQQDDGEQVLLDGHNRLRICLANRLPYKTEVLALTDRRTARIWIRENAMSRRNMPTHVKIDLGLANAADYAEEAREREREGGRTKRRQNLAYPPDDRKTDARVGALAGVSRETVRKYRAVKAKAPEKIAEIAKGKTTINAAFTQVRHAERKKDVAEKVSLPDAKYRVIYADPPWKYATPQHSKKAQVATLDTHYPSMSIADLCAMGVKDLVEDNAVLFLWTTSPLLEQAFEVIDAWGFTYKASIIWDKVKHNVGHYVSVRHEFLLLCTCGSCLPDVPKLFDSVVSIERTEHSVKPKEFRDMIDTLYPTGKRIELFARANADGWDAYGNEA